MTVKFSTIDNGARNHGRPFIQANVDGVRVRWDHEHGWRCDEHPDLDDDSCEEPFMVLDHLSRRIVDRIVHLEMTGQAPS